MESAHHETFAHRLERAAAYVLVGGATALLALGLVPASRHGLGPASISTDASLGRGMTTLAIPPLGTVSARTHSWPLDLEVRLDDIDPSALGQALAGEASRSILEDNLEEELRGATANSVLYLLLGSAVIGAVAGGLVPHRRPSSIVAGALGGVVFVALSFVVTGTTYDVGAFREPRFTGALEHAPQVIETVNKGIGSLEELRSRYETAAERLADLLALVAEPTRSPRSGTVAILHISDLHSNPLGVELANQLAGRFDVDAVLDTGDVTSFGAPVEARLGSLISRIKAPYVFVPGNHDSSMNRRALDHVRNVHLLDGEVFDVSGVEIMGFADPTFTASNETSTEEGNEIRLSQALAVAARARAEAPDVLAVHDVRLAAQAVGHVPLVVAGHMHERAVEEIEGTVVLTVGSIGATGLGSFIVEAELDYEAEVLYFRAGSLEAVDYIRFSSLGGDFEVERTTFEMEAQEAG